MQSRRNDWTFRLKQELKSSYNAYFITLTYADHEIPEVIDEKTGEYKFSLCKRDFQLFMKSLRAKQSKKTDIKIRYYSVGEYGTKTHRPHYHAILFNVHQEIINQITDIWQLGHTHTGQVTDASIHYVTKYHVNKSFQKLDLPSEPEFTLMSRRPGIGSTYIKINALWHQENGYNYVVNNGYKQRLPRYFKNKLFTEDELKAMSKINEINNEKAQQDTYQKLLQLGIKDPYTYMYECNMNEQKQVKRKNKNENDMF